MSLAVLAFVTLFAFGINAQSINFESPTYVLGNINGQDGWSKTGPYDVAVAPSGGITGFGAQSLRISNGVTSGSFGDQAFSKSNPNEAGETSAQNGGLSGGIRSNRFEYQFSIASVIPGAQQPGLLISVSPDRGDGARMSYLRFEDLADGIHVYFDDYQDLAPFGVSLPDATGCGAEDDFFETDIATLSRSTPHTIRFVIDFYDGPRNDVVKIYIDGVLRKVGTTWEDYFRYCEGNPTRTVDSMLFRAGGTSVPANTGNGFLVDGISAATGTSSVVTVSPSNPHGWAFLTESGTGTGSFVSGPATPPIGLGSARLTVGGSPDGQILGKLDYAGVRLDQITSLGYSSYRTSGDPALAPSFAFNFDFDLTDGTTGWQGRMVYEPYFTETVNTGVWQNWNPQSGKWFFTGAPGNANCTMAVPCTWSQVLSLYPNGGVNSTPTLGGIVFKAGSGWSSGFDGNVDRFVIGIGGTETTYNFDPSILVDDDGVQCPTAFPTIQAAINAAAPGSTVQVCAGTYNEDVLVNKANLTLIGSGVDVSTIVGPMGGGNDTVLISQPGVTLDGFTVTRAGNVAGTWGTTENIQGVNVSNSVGVSIQNNKITGNRNAIYVSASSNNVTIRRNIIDFNRTGVHLVDNNGATIEENFITNNWTMGILYRSEGGPAPTQMTVRGNNISGNWYSEIEFREPVGVASLNMSGNYLGTTTPSRVLAESMEPPYFNPPNSQIPVAYGGTSVPPASHPTVSGSESSFVDYSPFLNSGVDTQPGTPGFQGDFANVTVNADSSQANGAGGNIQEGINLVNSGGTVTALSGTYSGNVDINKAATLLGTPTFTGSIITTVAGATIAPGLSPGIVNSGNLSLTAGSNVNVELLGPTPGTGHDQINVTGTVSLGNANLNVVQFAGAPPASYTIINNDGGDAVTGTFNGLPEGASFVVSGNTFSITYVGGTGNDVVITSVAITCNAVSIPTAIPTLTGVQLDVPINTDDLTGRGALGYETTITYDPAVLSYVGVVQAGTLSSGLTILPNLVSAGTLNITGYSTGSTPLSGTGTLIKVTFQVIGPINPTPSAVNLSSFIFNEGNPCSTTTNGSVLINSGTLSGSVTYINGVPSTPGVPNVTLSGVGSINVATVTDGSGNYSLGGFGAGAYTVTPSKPALPLGSTNTAISNTDATRVAQHTVGLVTLNANQIIAGDVTGNGTVSNLDATYISQWKVGIANPGSTGSWIFQPVSRSYPGGLAASISGENYNAILKGDVTGNWNPLESPFFAVPIAEESKDAVSIVAPELSASAGSVVTIPISTTNLASKGVTGYEFEVTYDPDVLEVPKVAADTAASISSGMSVASNSPEPGRLLVFVYDIHDMAGEGTLINLYFNVNGKAGSSSPINIRNLTLNEGEIVSRSRDGSVQVIESLDSGVVRGRVLNGFGRGIPRAQIVVTSSSGETIFGARKFYGPIRGLKVATQRNLYSNGYSEGIQVFASEREFDRQRGLY